MRRSKIFALSNIILILAICFAVLSGCSAKPAPDPDPKTFSISGKVTQNGAGISGVTVSLSGKSSSSATTDSSGDYRFSGLSNGTYTITPSKSGYNFNPGFITVTVSNGNQIGNNFAVVPNTFSISGNVAENGTGISSIAVTLSGDSSATGTTDSNGDFSFNGLSSGAYTITPSKSGYGFDPEYISASVNNGDLTNENFVATPAQLPPIETKAVWGRVYLPDQTPIDPTSLRVQSVLGVASLSSTGDFSGLPVVDEGSGQIVFVLDGADNPIMMGFISPQATASASLTIGPREMALGLILLNPYLMIFPESDREQLLTEAEVHSDFNGLVNYITAALIQSPQNALDFETNPHIYHTAMGIGLKILDSYNASSLSKSKDLSIASPVGPEENPHINDPSGPDITFVNPKMIFYGVDINPSVNNVKNLLLRGKGGLVRAWPPFSETPPIERIFNLGDGSYTITFYKGFNFSINGWLDFRTAAGKATWSNFLKGVGIVIDVIGAMDSILKLDDKRIDMMVSYLTPPDISMGSRLVNALKKHSWLEVISSIIEIMRDNWHDIAYWLYQQWPGDATTTFLKSAGKVFTGVAKSIPYVKGFILGVKAVNEYIPFGYDLVTAPPVLSYDVQQTNGNLSEVSRKVPPNAEFTFSPLQPSVGEAVNFDAAASVDDRDSSSTLLVRWDFDGDGTWDTSWSTNKTATYSYSDRGSFRAVLDVMDSDDQIGSAGHDIYVGSSDELKIVLTWGQSPFDLDSHLWTPPIEGSSYHVYYHNKCQTLSNPPYVMLDLDDTSSYGPETVWFERIYPGTYTYAVNQYSWDGSLITSGATLTVIGRNGVIATFNVPTVGSGSWWTVFEMDGSTRNITPINVISGSVATYPASTLSMPPKKK
jgi:hypothetical protein